MTDKQIDNSKPWLFKKGQSGNLAGRPKGKTIKERVSDWLEEHPDDMKGFVKHFAKRNKELTWQMLEGRPAQATDLTSKGEKVVIPILGGISQQKDEDKTNNKEVQ